MNPDPPPRRAAIALVTPDGTPIGRLPEVPVATRWWPDVQAVVQAVREAYGLEVVVLRMLDSELPRPHGGGVTYLAETGQPIARSPLAAEALAAVRRHARRAAAPPPLGDAWRPGPGPGLGRGRPRRPADRARRRGGADAQLEPVEHLAAAARRGHSAWLKVVPPFFAHEGDMLRRLQSNAVPRLLGHDGDRVLLADVEGDDQYDAAEPELLRDGRRCWSTSRWRGSAASTTSLAIGLPDWRGRRTDGPHRGRRRSAFGELSPRTGARSRPSSTACRPGSPPIEACGIPDTLVHGDYRPGNVRGAPDG